MAETRRGRTIGLVMIVAVLCGVGSTLAEDRISFRRDGRERQVVGQVLVEDQEGGVLLQGRDSVLWIIPREEIVGRERDEQPFELLDDEQLAQQLLAELPEGFQIHTTAHYTICYNTSDAYAQWCGALYERLHRAFYSFWRNSGWDLPEPPQRLVALVFDGPAAFQRYSEPELGDAAAAMMGYYNMRTNRVTMYDLTGLDGTRQSQRGVSSAAHINQILQRPEAERTVATIVHEATHQLAYNSGLQTRYADCPLWVSEGLAIYFETPDLRSTRGWRGVGALHRLYARHFQRSLETRQDDPLMTVLADDARFRDPQTSTDAYADAWALSYYLLRARRQEYVSYLQSLAQLPPLSELSKEQRVERFREAFGHDLAELSEQWQRYMLRVR